MFLSIFPTLSRLFWIFILMIMATQHKICGIAFVRWRMRFGYVSSRCSPQMSYSVQAALKVVFSFIERTCSGNTTAKLPIDSKLKNRRHKTMVRGHVRLWAMILEQNTIVSEPRLTVYVWKVASGQLQRSSDWFLTLSVLCLGDTSNVSPSCHCLNTHVLVSQRSDTAEAIFCRSLIS